MKDENKNKLCTEISTINIFEHVKSTLICLFSNIEFTCFRQLVRGKSNLYNPRQLENTQDLNDNQLALAFKTLGDIYLHWKQYDLAISNYQSSLSRQKNIQVED